MTELIFLKLGGSLITDKTLPYTPRLDKLADLTSQIARFIQSAPDVDLVLGHGSGSFGHTAAKQFRTRDGIEPIQPGGNLPRVPARSGAHLGEDKLGKYWYGFTEVWFQASELNRFVMECLHSAGVPALALAPVSSVVAENGKVLRWDVTPLKSALAAGIVPVVYGDVIFDTAKGGTILSTEDLFEYLAQQLQPQRILLAGLEGAVWADFPERKRRVEKITSESFKEIKQRVGGSHGADVTGGMESKVQQMLDLVSAIPGLSAQIFSGEEPENLEKALSGQNLGTLITK
jgi:isopentenyl phosphate kinase